MTNLPMPGERQSPANYMKQVQHGRRTWRRAACARARARAHSRTRAHAHVPVGNGVV